MFGRAGTYLSFCFGPSRRPAWENWKITMAVGGRGNFLFVKRVREPRAPFRPEGAVDYDHAVRGGRFVPGVATVRWPTSKVGRRSLQGTAG